MQGSFGGDVRQTGPRRLEADYPHRFITVLLGFPVFFFGFSAISGIVGAIVTAQPALLGSAVLGGGFAAFLGHRLRHRLRSMGSFVLDLDQNELVRRRGQREVDRYTAHDIARIHKQWDPFHRDFGRHFWLVLDTRDGRSYRVGKAPQNEVDHTLALLRSWGLPA